MGEEEDLGQEKLFPLSEYVSFAKKAFCFSNFQKGDLLLMVDNVSLCGLTHSQVLISPNFSHFPNIKFNLFLFRPCPL